MRVVNLASGSDGNITYLETDNTRILVDIGLSCKEVEKRIALLGKVGSDIDAILITHEHSDHIKGLEVFVSKFKTKVYVHHDGIEAVKCRTKKLSNENFSEFFCQEFFVGDIKVVPFKVPHDSVCCVGFSFIENEKKISILTDLGQTNSDIIKNIQSSQLVYLESNHDIDMLKQNMKYPATLKARILSNRGHLSNIACADVIPELVKTGARQIVLAHLSPENNSPDIAFRAVTERLKTYGIIEGEHVRIDVATPLPGKIFKIK